MEEFVRVAGRSDIEDGEFMTVEVGNEIIVLSRFAGDFFAVAEACTHAGGPLGDGYQDGETIECPWHASRFSLRTGRVEKQPADKALGRYAVRVDGEDVLVGPPLTD